MKVRSSEVDGVPAFWIASDARPTAGLVFRVGRSDETYARSGITHLIEHLALYRVGITDFHYNGQVDPTTTLFAVEGDADDIAGFFGTVCGALHDLPLERLAHEVDILHAEESGQDTGAVGYLLRRRYGPVGYGLPAYPQIGLDQLTGDDLQAWAAHWFTRGNAAFWMAGGDGPPGGLRLPLPDGPCRPAPGASRLAAPLPAYVGSDSTTAAMQSTLERSVAGSVFSMALERRLLRVLRYEKALAYSPTAVYKPRDAATAEIFAVADGPPGRSMEMAVEFLAQLERPYTGEELAAAVEAVKRARREPGWEAPHVASMADDHLLGAQPHDWQAIDDAFDALDLDALNSVATAVNADAVLVLPLEEPLDHPRLSPLEDTPRPRVAGQIYRAADYPVDTSVIIAGPDGVSVAGKQHEATVLYGECVAMRAWPDGARRLTGADEVSLMIDPRVWRDGPALVARLDAAVPSDRVVRMPPRAPGALAHPRTTRTQRLLAYPPHAVTTWGIGLLIIAVCCAVPAVLPPSATVITEAALAIFGVRWIISRQRPPRRPKRHPLLIPLAIAVAGLLIVLGSFLFGDLGTEPDPYRAVGNAGDGVGLYVLGGSDYQVYLNGDQNDSCFYNDGRLVHPLTPGRGFQGGLGWFTTIHPEEDGVMRVWCPGSTEAIRVREHQTQRPLGITPLGAGIGAMVFVFGVVFTVVRFLIGRAERRRATSTPTRRSTTAGAVLGDR